MFFQDGKWNLYICLRTRKNLNSSLLTLLHHFICSQDVLSDSIVWSLFLFHTVGYLYSGEGQGIFFSRWRSNYTDQQMQCSFYFILWLLMHKHREWREKKMNFDENGYCFCLFQLTGSETVWEAFEQQVANYKFQTSLFDTVVSYYSNCL